MRVIVSIIVLMMMTLGVAAQAEPQPALYDFASRDDLIEWVSQDDVVMGGVSSSSIKATQSDTALFSGVLSLENNGGFASVRTFGRRFALGDYEGIEIRLRSDGKIYGVSIRGRSENGFGRLNYRSDFETEADEWQTIQIPFDSLTPTRFGFLIDDADLLNPDSITSLGLIISNEQEGSFAVEVDWIRVYGQRYSPSNIQDA